MNGCVLIAIDPGKSGGFAWTDPQGRVIADPMPQTAGGLLNYIRDALAGADGVRVTAYVEHVSGYVGGAGQPGSRMFAFGQGFGFIQGVLMACGIPTVLVRPQRWQAALALGRRGRLTKPEWKRKLKATAERLFPTVKVTLATADALLLLAYAQREERGSRT